MRAAVALWSLALAVLVAAGCGSEARVGQSTNAQAGKELFTQRCGTCHVLADAGTQGKVGPNLDEAFKYVRVDHGFEESTLRDVVRGQIAYPVENPPTGAPGMPADLVTGDDADAVASYVASVAGLPVQGGGGAQGGGGDGETDGKTLFASNCAGCHTLAAADATGTVGPDLDEGKPDQDLVVDRVTNGKGAMPAFKGTLSEEQIDAVAEFVAQSAGGG